MNLFAAVLGFIVLTLLTVSMLQFRGVKTKADYLVAGRSLPAYVLVFTLLSSWIGSGSLLGGAENAYRHGFAALWQAGGGWAGLLLIYFIAPRARKFAQFTIPDLLEARYNQAARVLGVIAVLFAFTAITSYQLTGGGDILHLVFPTVISADLGKYIIAAFVILFTAIAGMASVAYMDVVIGILAIVAMCLTLPVLLHHAGGWSHVTQTLPATHFQLLGDFTLLQGLELFIPTCLLMLGNQSMYQKFFSAKSEQAASRAVVGWIIGTVLLETLIVAIAVVGSVVFPTGEVAQRPREILAYTALHGLPAFLGALLMGSVFAKDHFHGQQLSFLSGDESGQRCVRPLPGARCLQQTHSRGLTADGGAAGHLGVVPGPAHGIGAEEDALRLHHLFCCAHAGDSGGVLFASRQCCRSGKRHRRGHSGYVLLGCAVRAASSASSACPVVTRFFRR